tara:strand:- start:27 stop:353 length:327 start_codon:yes stop_codon:yes gene_type:complete
MKQSLRQRKAISDRVAIINQIERETKRKEKITETIGYVGLVFVQASIIPNLLFGMAWLMHSSLLIGLCCYQYRNYHDDNAKNVRLYSLGNYCGITLNILMLLKIGGVL